MKSNAPTSGQAASQTSSQLPSLSQQINNSMTSQMQNSDPRKMDSEFLQLRIRMQQKIYNILQRRNQSNDWLHKLPEIVKCLEERIFRNTGTKDEYLILCMESDENRFFAIISSICDSKQRESQQVRSSTPGVMIPTPRIQQNRNAQSIISCSVENPMSSSSVECYPATNAGNLLPTGNGLTDVNAPFHLANGMRLLLCSFQLPSETRYWLSSWFRCKKYNAFKLHWHAKAVTPGYADPQIVSLGSESYNAIIFPGVILQYLQNYSRQGMLETEATTYYIV